MPDQDPAKERACPRLRQRLRHAARVASRLCTRCGTTPPEPGLKVCRRCCEKKRAADRARRARARQQGQLYGGRDPELCRRADRARDRRSRRARQAAGLCTSCGRRPRPDDGSVCEPCRAARRALDRRRYVTRRAAGLCVRCAQPTVGGLSRCGRCLTLEKERVSPERGERHQQETLRQTARPPALRRLRGRHGGYGALSPLRLSLQFPHARASPRAALAAANHRGRPSDRRRARDLRDGSRGRRLPRLCRAAHRPGGDPLERAAPGALLTISAALPQASRRGACYAPARFRTGVPLAAIGPTGGAVREALGKSASAGAGCSQELVGSLEGVNGVGIEKVSSPFSNHRHQPGTTGDES